MQFFKLISPEAVRVIGHISSKKRLFQTLGEIASSAYGIDPSAAVDALQERESLGSTAVGHGIAIPHARIEGVGGVVGAFVRLDKPIDFNAVDRQPVDLVFALFAPGEAGVDHLKALALVSRTLRDNGVCAKLRANADPETLHAVLVEAQANQAA